MASSSPSTIAQNRHRFFSTCGNYVYHIAIIDFLTQFNIHKRLESFYKVVIKNQKAENVSCVNSELYGNRFLEFMNKEVFINEDKRRENSTKVDSDKIKDGLFRRMEMEFKQEYSKYKASQ